MTKDEMLRRIAKGLFREDTLLTVDNLPFYWKDYAGSVNNTIMIAGLVKGLRDVADELEKPEYPPELEGDELAKIYWEGLDAQYCFEYKKFLREELSGQSHLTEDNESHILAAAKALQARGDHETCD